MASWTEQKGLRGYLTAQRLGYVVLAATTALSGGLLFVIDITSPRGVLDGVGYCAVVALTSRFGRRALIASAAIATVLTLLGAALVPDEGISVGGMWANRAFAIGSIWVVALLMHSRIELESRILNREGDLRRYEAALARMVRHCLLQDVKFSEQLRFVCQTSAEALGCEAGLIQLRNPDGKTVTVLEAWQKPPRAVTRQPGTVLQEDRFHKPRLMKEFVVATDDVALAELEPATRRAIRDHGVRATLAAEIFHGTPQSATIWLGRGEEHHWTHEEIAFARSVAGLIALLFSTRRNAETLAALELIDEGIYTEDAAGNIQYSNRAANLLAHGAAGRNEIPRAEDPLAENHDQREIRFEDRDLEIHRTRLPAGGLIARLIDVTDRNIVAAEKLRLEARLQQAAKMEAIGQLASGVAHDFNNVLGAIIGFAGFIAQDATDSQTREFAQRILTAAGRGKDMVDQIMAFAEARTISHDVSDLARAMETSRELLALSMYPGAMLDIEVPAAPLLVRGNIVQISQMINNLVANGRDALDGGSGEIEVNAQIAPQEEIDRFWKFPNTASERLLGEAVAGQRYVRLTVRDSGAGIAPEIIDRIFEPFFSTKERQQGTGLGLAVVHGVIRSHGGFCHLQSVKGEGTVFHIYFPLAAEDRIAAPASVHDCDRGRVLIVDDEADVADTLSIGLERLGYVTVAVQNPLVALAAIEEDPSAFDTLLTDQQMPAMSGMELIRKARLTAPHLRAVLCTGDAGGLSEAQALTLGVDRVLYKPVEIQSVAEAVRPHLDGGT
ncbi:MAG TPA: ATP-binding protein [Rhizomicrobium sp.]